MTDPTTPEASPPLFKPPAPGHEEPTPSILAAGSDAASAVRPDPEAPASPPGPEPAPAVVPAAATATVVPPRTRWAAIVWGLFLAALAAVALWILADGDRRDAVTVWVAGMGTPTAVAVALLAIGVLLLVAGLAGLLRRTQRRRGTS